MAKENKGKEAEGKQEQQELPDEKGKQTQAEKPVDIGLEKIKAMPYGYGNLQIVKELNKHIGIGFFDIRDQPIITIWMTKDSAKQLGLYLNHIIQ